MVWEECLSRLGLRAITVEHFEAFGMASIVQENLYSRASHWVGEVDFPPTYICGHGWLAIQIISGKFELAVEIERRFRN